MNIKTLIGMSSYFLSTLPKTWKRHAQTAPKKYPCFVFSPGLADGRGKVRWTGKKKSVGVSAYSHARYHRVEEEGYSPFSSLSFLICSSTAFIFWASSDSSSRSLSAFFLARSTRLLPFLLLLVRKHRLFS